ncbi:AtpZ/AtpI family protein [Caulifigura coniformis]
MEFADASLWLSRIFSTIVPGLIGLWIDDRFGTRYFALIGLILGLTSGILHFVQATRGVFSKQGRKSLQSSRSSSGRKLP